MESGVLAKISADSLTSGTAFQISSTGGDMSADGSLLRVDANSQKLGRVVDIQANYLERGTALNVGSNSSNTGNRSSLVTIEGSNPNATALQMMRLIQMGTSSNNSYYQPASPLVIETNIDESIYIRSSSTDSNSDGAMVVLSRDRHGSNPTEIPVANEDSDTVGTLAFAGYNTSNKIKVSTIFVAIKKIKSNYSYSS